MKQKILVTHVRPHLDDIAGIWLYQKYVPGWKKSDVEFVPTSADGAKPYGGKLVDSDPNIVHIGIARGKFDEHKGNIGKSAALLVFEYLQKSGQLPLDALVHRALKRVVAYVLDEDLGKRKGLASWPYEIGAVLMWIPDSDERLQVGSRLLEALLYFFKDYEKLDKDWKRKKVFRTKWGKGVGVISDQKGSMRAYEEGYVLIAQIDEKRGYRSIRAHANSRVNLTAAYKKVRSLEPQADWYLHHSKRMLICGSDVAPQSARSKLTLQQLIDLMKK